MSKDGSKRSFIDSVEVKKPCTESWDEMSGNERVRFCSHCSKHVNNLSEMTRKEATRLVRSSGGRLCIRYIQHPVTRRPMFAEQLLQITRRTPRLTAGVMSASLSLSTMAYAQQSGTEPSATPVAVSTPLEPVAGSETPDVVQDIPVQQLVDLPAREQFVTMGVVATIEREYTQPLMRAIQNEDIDEIRQLLASGEDVNGKEDDRTTPLFVAVATGDVEIVQLLLDFGAKVNARDENRQTPLMHLDSDATPELVELLLRHGAKLNVTDKQNNTPLITAIDRGIDAEVAVALIRGGADARVANKSGSTPLMEAAERDDLDLVKLLIEAGSDVNAKDEDDETAWDKTSDEEIEQYLVGHGAIVSPE